MDKKLKRPFAVKTLNGWKYFSTISDAEFFEGVLWEHNGKFWTLSKGK